MKKHKKLSKAKQIGIIIGIIAVAIGGFCLYWFLSSWPVWYASRLDDFFGEGNWSVISEETSHNRDYISRNNMFGEGAARNRTNIFYREWNILYENEDGKEEVWQISNQMYQYNHEKNSIFSSGRYSGSQALTLELMEISFIVIEETVHRELIKGDLTDKEAECIYVLMSYKGGNPPKSFYDDLADEPWFTIDGVTAENYLATDLYDFFLDIKIYDYKFEKLSKEEQANVLASLKEIEKRLLDAYGKNASFEISYTGYDVEYINGVKQ